MSDLKKDLLRLQIELNKKNKQLNQNDKVLRMTKDEYLKIAEENKLLKTKLEDTIKQQQQQVQQQQQQK